MHTLKTKMVVCAMVETDDDVADIILSMRMYFVGSFYVRYNFFPIFFLYAIHE